LYIKHKNFYKKELSHELSLYLVNIFIWLKPIWSMES